LRRVGALGSTSTPGSTAVVVDESGIETVRRSESRIVVADRARLRVLDPGHGPVGRPGGAGPHGPPGRAGTTGERPSGTGVRAGNRAPRPTTLTSARARPSRRAHCGSAPTSGSATTTSPRPRQHDRDLLVADRWQVRVADPVLGRPPTQYAYPNPDQSGSRWARNASRPSTASSVV
jgi:hypothetical protein